MKLDASTTSRETDIIANCPSRDHACTVLLGNECIRRPAHSTTSAQRAGAARPAPHAIHALAIHGYRPLRLLGRARGALLTARTLCGTWPAETLRFRSVPSALPLTRLWSVVI